MKRLQAWWLRLVMPFWIHRPWGDHRWHGLRPGR